MSADRSNFLEILEDWDGIGVVVRQDQRTGTWIFIALHDDTLGPATGGCRMKVLPIVPKRGSVDVPCALAEGNDAQVGGDGLPVRGRQGGAGRPARAARSGASGAAAPVRRAAQRPGGGRFGTGADLGTTTEDMQTIAEVSEHVIGVHGRTRGPMDPSPYTAPRGFRGDSRGFAAPLRFQGPPRPNRPGGGRRVRR